MDNLTKAVEMNKNSKQNNQNQKNNQKRAKANMPKY